MNQAALGSWLLDCTGRDRLASVFLLSPFMFATDLVAMDRGAQDLDGGSNCLSSLPSARSYYHTNTIPTAPHCTALQLTVSINHQ